MRFYAIFIRFFCDFNAISMRVYEGLCASIHLSSSFPAHDAVFVRGLSKKNEKRGRNGRKKRKTRSKWPTKRKTRSKWSREKRKTRSKRGRNPTQLRARIQTRARAACVRVVRPRDAAPPPPVRRGANARFRPQKRRLRPQRRDPTPFAFAAANAEGPSTLSSTVLRSLLIGP